MAAKLEAAAMRHTLHLTFLFLFALLSVAFAQQKPFRPCTAQDLIGNWEMVLQTASVKIEPNDPYHYKYQRYVFLPEGVVKHATSTSPMTSRERKIQEKAPSSQRYRVVNDGRLLIRHDSPGHEQSALCTLMTQDEGNVKKGDLLLSYFVNGTQVPAFQRLLRKEK